MTASKIARIPTPAQGNHQGNHQGKKQNNAAMVAGRRPWRNEILDRVFGLPGRYRVAVTDGPDAPRAGGFCGDFLGRFVERDALDIVADVPAPLIG
jgi:hypothetical protein